MPNTVLPMKANVGAQQDEGRMGDVDDVEHAERDRHADRNRRIEAAEQPGPTERR
jgi:hypothetical protein